MATPFGFSAGDIAMAIKFVGQVANALKETGGAASDYREVLQYLEGLLLTLQHLQRLDTSSADPSLVKAVRTLTAAAEHPVREFVGEMGKFGKAMGEERSVTSGFRKVEWAVVAAKKADRLRLKIAAQMQPIQLLLESQTLQCFDMAAERDKELKSEIEGHAAQQIVFNQRLLETLTTLQTTVETANSAGNPLKPPIPKDDTFYINCSPSAKSVEELTKLGEQLCVVIWCLLRDIQHLIALLFLISPQLLSHLRNWYQSLVRAPRWLLDENIHFENALGELRSLPFAYFGDIRLFEAFLEKDFRNKPGEFQVLLHHYQILTPSGLRLDRKSWTQLVRPGGHIYMSMNIPRTINEIMPGDDLKQARKTVAEYQRTSKSAIWIYKTCPDCGLQFFAMPKLDTPLYRMHKGPPIRLLGEEDYHGEQVIDPTVPRKRRSKRHKLLALDSGDVLPFKRMHVFGRAERRLRHNEPGLHAEPTVQITKMDHLNDQKPESLSDARTALSELAIESEMMEVCDAGGGTVDLALHHTMYSSDQESAFFGTTSYVRCDDNSYHIRPIMSMVTTKRGIRSWLSEGKQRPKQPGSHTLTCQFVRCERTFEGWKELDQHLRDDHMLDHVTETPVAAVGKPPSEYYRTDSNASADVPHPTYVAGRSIKMSELPRTPVWRMPTDQNFLESARVHDTMPLREEDHGLKPETQEQKPPKEAPPRVETMSNAIWPPYGFDDDEEIWCPC